MKASSTRSALDGILDWRSLAVVPNRIYLNNTFIRGMKTVLISTKHVDETHRYTTFVLRGLYTYAMLGS